MCRRLADFIMKPANHGMPNGWARCSVSRWTMMKSAVRHLPAWARSSNLSRPNVLSRLRPRVSGHLLPGPAGSLAVVLWEPPSESASRFAALHVPSAADEMNKSRRMASLQARAFAMLGGTVALLDLRGTGDSGGEHGDATWEDWRADVVCAWHWLSQRVRVPSVLWGYELNPGLVKEAEAADLRSIAAPASRIIWHEVSIGDPPALSSTSSKIVSRWTDDGANLESTVVRAPSFWATQEIVEAPELIAATSASIAAVFAPSTERAR